MRKKRYAKVVSEIHKMTTATMSEQESIRKERIKEGKLVTPKEQIDAIKF